MVKHTFSPIRSLTKMFLMKLLYLPHLKVSTVICTNNITHKKPVVTIIFKLHNWGVGWGNICCLVQQTTPPPPFVYLLIVYVKVQLFVYLNPECSNPFFFHRTLWLLMMYQTKFGCQGINSSENIVERVIF